MNTGDILTLNLEIPDIGQIEAVELCEKLGQGAFGLVWKVRPVAHRELEKGLFGKWRKKDRAAANTEDYYVLKYIEARDATAAERIRREAAASALIQSRHLAYCYGCAEIKPEKTFALLFHYEQGKNFAQWLEDNRKASWPQKKGIFLDILDGVRAIHQANIVHRDLKPANIFITRPHNEPRILDFGVAKFREMGRMTLSGEALGTLAYAPPEFSLLELNGYKADERHDLYSLGILLYEIAAGTLPYYARLPQVSVNDIALRKYQHILEISAFEFADDPRVAEAIIACTMTDPERRLRRVDDLIAILNGQPRHANDMDDLSELTVIDEETPPTPHPSQEGKTGTSPQPTAAPKCPDHTAPVKSAATPQKPAQTPRIVVTQERKPETKADPKTPQVGDSWTEPTTGMVFMWIPPGRFMMGSPKNEEGHSYYESPVHEVRFAQGFWMGKYPVTQAEWHKIMRTNPSHFTGERRPVEEVSWNDAQEFLQKLNAVGNGHARSLQYRLPSEAEWEYACRAGTTTPFYFGETISTDQANYDGNSVYGNGKKGVYRKQTTDVGSFPPNAWGLCDMHGNVWEWQSDTYHESYKNAPNDGSIWGNLDDKKAKVLRGGSWIDDPSHCRCAVRVRFNPVNRYYFCGFRVVVGVPWT